MLNLHSYHYQRFPNYFLYTIQTQIDHQQTVNKTQLDSLSLQSQETRIHRATRYGSETCSHFQVTMGKVVRFPPSWWPPLAPSSECGTFPVPEVDPWSPPDPWSPLGPWSPLDLMPCCVSTVLLSSLDKLRHLDTVGSAQSRSRKCQVRAMFRKILLKLRCWLKCSDQSISLSFLHSLPVLSSCHFVLTYVHVCVRSEHGGHFTVILSAKDAGLYSRWSSAHLHLSSYYFVPRPVSLTFFGDCEHVFTNITVIIIESLLLWWGSDTIWFNRRFRTYSELTIKGY